MNRFKLIERALAGLLVAATSIGVSGNALAASVLASQEPASTVATASPVGSENGYGPWRFGMSLAEVTAITAHAPYEPVRASMGGVETYTGGLGDGVEKISFVFNSADQLYVIRLWYDLGDSYQDTLAAFHKSYVHLTDTFGPAQVDTGYPLDPGMSAEEFVALVPDRFAPTGEEFEIGADGSPTEFSIDTRLLRIVPLTKPAGLHVAAMFVKLHPTTSYAANVFYQSLAHTE